MDRHEHHHELLAKRGEALRQVRNRPRSYRIDAGRRLWVTLAGHLRSEHGWKRVSGPPLSVDQLHALHVQAHEADK